MQMSEQNYDVVVVGGGPAGSTLATFVAMQGHSVLLIERERMPRHQIGESLLPSTVHGIIPLLGVSEEVKNANFKIKRGGTFRWGKNAEPWTFSFASSAELGESTGYAYQVERERFDLILLNNARRKGVEVREGHSVKSLLTDNDRVVGVVAIDPEGGEYRVKARYVADASGNTSRLYSHVGDRKHSDFFQNIALYGYYLGGKRFPSPNDGNILCASFSRGWFWYIPLTDELTSVGAVVAKEHSAEIARNKAGAMREFISECPIIAEHLKDAKRVEEGSYGQYRARKDFSYSNTSFWRPGIVLVGDAACFVDPVFSSGVHLATYSALLAARSINSCLSDGMDEARAFEEYEMRYRREYGVFYRFLIAFYDMNSDEGSYYWKARSVLNSPDNADEAFIRLVAGIGASGEPLFASSEAFVEATQSHSNSMVRGLSEPGGLKPHMMFSEDFSEVHVQLLSQASGTTVDSHPLREMGLVPSRDGLRWREVAA